LQQGLRNRWPSGALAALLPDISPAAAVYGALSSNHSGGFPSQLSSSASERSVLQAYDGQSSLALAANCTLALLARSGQVLWSPGMATPPAAVNPCMWVHCCCWCR
jgi:hypothetical protein